MKRSSSSVDIDILLANLDKEAAMFASQDSEFNFHPCEIDAPRSFTDLVLTDSGSFKIKKSYDKEDFLRFDDVEFITSSYRGVLCRDADETGLTDYLARLRGGEDKVMLLAELMRSEEGRRQNVKIRGMRAFVFFYKRLKAPFVGCRLKALIELILSVLHLPRQQATLRSEITRLAQTSEMNDKSLATTTTSLLERMTVEFEKQHNLSAVTLEQIDVLAQKLAAIQKEQNAIRGQFGDDQRRRQQLLNHLAQNDSPPDVRAASAIAVQEDRLASFYRAFEDDCRGAEGDIKAQFEIYLPDVIKALSRQGDGIVTQPAVIDIGCGRGEWLQLLSENKVPALGVDNNGVMIKHCLDQGLSVREEDVLTLLQGLSSNSLVVLTGFHIIEHLPFSALFALFDQAYRVLAPGGIIIFETPNPENVLVGSHTFYHDPTHRNPITPTFIQFMARFFGFSDIEIRRLHPYPESAMVKGRDPLTERVNGHFCGPQDFSILAQKPSAPPSRACEIVP